MKTVFLGIYMKYKAPWTKILLEIIYTFEIVYSIKRLYCKHVAIKHIYGIYKHITYIYISIYIRIKNDWYVLSAHKLKVIFDRPKKV